MSRQSARAANASAPSAPAEGTGPFKEVPASLADRLRLREAALAEMASATGQPLTRRELEQAARRLLKHLNLAQPFMGFAMVMLSNAYWGKRLQAIPYSRRLLLLPRCLEQISDQGGHTIPAIRQRALELGYHVLVADGMPVVVKTLAQHNVDAVVGVACLDSLEASFDKIRQLGIPAIGLPLLTGQCKDTAADLAWLSEMIESTGQPPENVHTGGYLGLMRAGGEMFAPHRLEHLLSVAVPKGLNDAMDTTATLAREWLAVGGKRLRPFVTLAAASALKGNPDPNDLGDSVFRVALAIEAFHKASLVHDDIEDDDAQRYGQPTLHRRCGIGMAINVGDYLLGLGYRLVSSGRKETSPAVTAAILDQMSRAHVHLAQGQGAELAWRQRGEFGPPTQEVLKIYALKTSPAFEAALLSGMLLGGSDDSQDQRLRIFSRHVGVGFQILNDLSDWQDDSQAARPTLLTAMALEATPSAEHADLIAHIRRSGQSADELASLRARFDELGVFHEANDILRKLRQRSVELAGQFTPPALGELLLFLVELILDKDE